MNGIQIIRPHPVLLRLFFLTLLLHGLFLLWLLRPVPPKTPVQGFMLEVSLQASPPPQVEQTETPPQKTLPVDDTPQAETSASHSTGKAKTVRQKSRRNMAAASQRASNGSAARDFFKASYLRNPSPDYPKIAKQLGWQGNVLLRVFITAEGLCERVEIESSSGNGVLDEAAVAAVERWQFIPAVSDGKNVSSMVKVPINFVLADQKKSVE